MVRVRRLEQIDQLLTNARLLAPFQLAGTGRQRSCNGHSAFGRPSIAMTTYLRLMLIKQRMSWD